MNYLTVSLPIFHRYLRDLQQRPPGPLRCPVGISRWAGHLEMIAASPGSEVERTLLLSWTDSFAVPRLPPDCEGALLLGRGSQRGRALGVVRLPSQAIAPLHRLRLVGPGMHTVSLQQDPLPEQLGRMVIEGSYEGLLARWSRTIGALNREVWQRLVSLHYAIVGMGRTGSSLALSLSRLGVSRLTLIDPDSVEIHNLGESPGFNEADIGRLKVEVVAASLVSSMAVSSEVVTVPGSITSPHALRAAQACDVLISCVDHDSARLAVSTMAAVFAKPLLDIAAGVHGQGVERQLGADVRLVLPGRCLLCFGGLRDEVEARQVLASAEAERAFYARRDWRRERAGSLASLNQCAAGVALRLLEDLIAERVQDSTWVHLEFDTSGHLTVSYPAVLPRREQSPCGLCNLTGWGEEGLLSVVDLLKQK